MPEFHKNKPDVLLAIDPGGIHVGMAMLRRDPAAKLGWNCTRAWEERPDTAANLVANHTANQTIDLLVVEEWRLYAQNARQKIGNDFPTSQLIGVFKYLCRINGTPICMQPAQMRLAARAAVKRQGVAFRANKDHTGGHSMDAELHAWTYVLRHGLTTRDEEIAR